MQYVLPLYKESNSTYVVFVHVCVCVLKSHTINIASLESYALGVILDCEMEIMISASKS